MERVKSENGYTLLITLGLIMMMMLFMFAFTRIAVSQKAQVEKTDTSIVTTALAEMGAEYYKEQIVSDINTMILTTTQEMQAIKDQGLGYSALTAEMQDLAVEKNNALSLYYASNYYVEQPTTPTEIKTGYTTIVEPPSRGYRLIERSSFDSTTETLSLKVVGFTEDEESEPIQVDLKLPSQLMWQGDKTETFTLNLSFEQYAQMSTDLTTTNVFTNDKQTANNEVFLFDSGDFYHFQGNAIFQSHQVDEGSLNKVKVLSNKLLEFQKHFAVYNSIIYGDIISINFDSLSKTVIHNSQLRAYRILITKGEVVPDPNADIPIVPAPNSNQQKVEFTGTSSICLLARDQVINTNYINNIQNLKNILLMDATSHLIYKKSDGDYIYQNGSERKLTSSASDNEIVNKACNTQLTFNEDLKVYEAFDPENMKISDVIYQ